MSSVFPDVPGYAGPFSLKEFLLRYFFLHLRFDSRAPLPLSVPNGPAPSAEPVLLLPPIGSFAVIVYVSLCAPPPPPVLSVPFAAGRGPPPPPGRPMTVSVLRHPFWAALFTRIGPAAAGFMAAWCPTAVQFAPAGGGLQVMGPPLKSAARPVAKQGRRFEAEELRKFARHEPPARPVLASSSSASLYRMNVSCLPLIGEAPARTPAEVRGSSVGILLDNIWPQPRASDADISLVACDLVPLVFPYSLPPRNEGGNDVNDGLTVREHLCRVMHSVLCSVSRMNTRGAAIKHAGFIEARIHNGAIPNLSVLFAPEPVVASYIRTLLEGMRWDGGPFWGDGPLLVRLGAIVQDWLRGGRHGVFPLSHFLHEIPVARVPWLRGFYTAGSIGPQRRSMVQQRVYLQLIFFLFQHIVPRLVRRSFHVTWSSKTPNAFVYIPIPVWQRLVRHELRSVCVRHRPRRPRRGPKQSKQSECSDQCEEAKDPGESDLSGRGRAVRVLAPLPMSLERVASRDAVWAKAAEQSVARDASDGGPLVLYSAIRFLPDGRKLRPIALVRLAPARALARMAVGPPRHPRALPYTLRSSLAPAAPRPNTTLLRQALSCLLAGAEEERAASGLARRTNASHQDEYAELRAFVEEARRFCAHPWLAQGIAPGTAAPGRPVVTMVRGDAARCYDRLPQDAVMAAVARLVPHEQYYTLRLTAIAPLTTTAPSPPLLPTTTRPTSAEAAASSTNANTDAPTNTSVDADMGTHASPSGVPGAVLVSSVRMQTVSSWDIAAGVLPGIPRGSIVWEEPLADDAALRGVDIRSVLVQHLHHHLVLVAGKLYVQRTGIAQGSAVAMLLCDALLTRVDAALSGILTQHEEPALLLRRVDDVLVVTLSRTAADRCHAALSRGWPDAGFACQTAKLRRSTEAPVPWCGLLWDPCTLELSIEWQRLGALRPRLAIRLRTGGEPLRSATRLVEIMCLRMPFTAMCGRINTRARVVQTFYEMGLLWARLLLQRLIENAAFVRPHIRTLMRPLIVAVAILQRLLRRHTSALMRLGSFCDVTGSEVRLCILVALHRTLQRRLRCMMTRCGSRKRLRDVLPLFAAVLRRRTEIAMATSEASCGGGASETAAALLAEDGPGSLSGRALAAVQASFSQLQYLSMEDGGTVGRWGNDVGPTSDLDDVLNPHTSVMHTPQSLPTSVAPGTMSSIHTTTAERMGSSSGGAMFPPLKKKSSKKGSSTAAAARGRSPQRRGKASGSRTSTPASRAVSGGSRTNSLSSTRKGSLRKGSQGGAKSPGNSRSGSRRKSGNATRASRESSASRKGSSSKGARKGSPGRKSSPGRKGSPSKKGGSRRGSPSKKGTRKGSSSKRKLKGGKSSRKRTPQRSGGNREDLLQAALRAISDEEMAGRCIISREEEIQRETYMPEYNLLSMNLMQTQVAQVNRRQQILNEAFKALQSHGLHLSSGEDANAAVEALRAQFKAEAMEKMESMLVENASLRNLLEEKRGELEKQAIESQELRDKFNRKLIRYEVESESLKAEVQSVLQTTQLDVERMKRELGHRLDVACASMRTPKYDTALRSMQELMRSVQEEIQEHHDTMSKLIVSIGAQNTFLDKSDSMHSNFPVRYRDELRRLDKDRLLNMLDVLSSQDIVVETVGKVLYVMQKSEHKTNVF